MIGFFFLDPLIYLYFFIGISALLSPCTPKHIPSLGHHKGRVSLDPTQQSIKDVSRADLASRDGLRGRRGPGHECPKEGSVGVMVSLVVGVLTSCDVLFFRVSEMSYRLIWSS